jgi:phosphoglucomutase/phosphomannomutase
MAKTATTFDRQSAHSQLTRAAEKNLISGSAAAHIRSWLDEPKYAKYAGEVARHIDEQKWRTLDDVFWTVIPFGTGGRRGVMYPIGCNAINEWTIGESAQGLANYVRKFKPSGPWSCGIAYDTRHRSREFAELCASILVGSGFRVYFLDDYRSTPELSFLVRYKQCDCGIMVTASHNPPSDNAVKVYWSNGGQLIPPHDRGVIEEVANVQSLNTIDFAQAVRDHRIVLCRDEVDQALLREHLRLSRPGPRDLKVIYSPLHGVGEFNVRTLLEADGFDALEIYQPHRQPDGDFPNVPDHVSNPENPAVFDQIIAYAQRSGGELILATDPDCDRMGAAAPLTLDSSGAWKTFNGNQLSSLLADFVLRQAMATGGLTPRHYVVTTLVTTPLVRRIAEAYGVRCFDQNLVGFKWICEAMDREGPELFLYGTEESHGFLIGQYCRDKDGAIACMLMSQLAAEAKHEGQSVHDRMRGLYERFGVYSERQLNLRMEGSDGMRRMQRLMDALRTNPPRQLGGMQVNRWRDFLHQRVADFSGRSESMAGPRDNLVMLDTQQEGNFVAARPSGTEPKVKFYMFAYAPPGPRMEVEAVRQGHATLLSNWESDLRAFAERI